jgi:Fe2+ transport system protein B
MSSACVTCSISGCDESPDDARADLDQTVIALAGNPNVGKTSIFNALTGMRQHTGNWPGKTVLRAEGSYSYDGHIYNVIDLPGTYSLSARSAEEEVARDFLCFEKPDVTVVVVDATALERNLNFVLQVSELTRQVIVCVNLLDEAARGNIAVDLDKLSRELGLPVVGTIARTYRGINNLKAVMTRVAAGGLIPRPKDVTYPADIERAASQLIPEIEGLVGDVLPARWVALRLLEGDTTILERLKFTRLNVNPGVRAALAAS